MVVLVAITSTPVNAAVPACELGGGTAMDTNRQLTEGETFVKTDRPLVVNLRFRPTKARPEQVGECMLPSGSEVAVKNGILQWVKACGNDEVNKNIFVFPFQPMKGLDGKDGLPGRDGKDGRDGRDGLPGWKTESLPENNNTSGWTCKTGCKVLIGVGVAAIGTGIYLLTRDKDDKGTPPGGSTGPAFFRATVTPRVGVIPPRHGKKGGFFIGASLSM